MSKPDENKDLHVLTSAESKLIAKHGITFGELQLAAEPLATLMAEAGLRAVMVRLDAQGCNAGIAYE